MLLRQAAAASVTPLPPLFMLPDLPPPMPFEELMRFLLMPMPPDAADLAARLRR
jgi:hypothetical protein